MKALFLQKYADYSAAREAHKMTVGVPAPLPEFEVIRAAYEEGVPLVINQEVIVSARYVTQDLLTVAVMFQGDPVERAFLKASDPYMLDLLNEWVALGGVVTAWQAPPVPSAADLEVDALTALSTASSGGRPDLLKLIKAKLISDLAFRLGVAPGALTGPQIQAERARIAAIYKTLS